MEPHTKAAAASAAKWALGLPAGFILGPIVIGLASGVGLSGKIIAEKLIVGIVWFPILFFGLWAWGTFSKKDPITGVPIQRDDSTSNQHLVAAPVVIQPAAVVMPTASTTVDKESTQNNKGNFEITTKQELNMENLEDWAYEKVGEELESNKPDKATWTKAFAQAGGDDKLTRVAYIKARFEKLMAAESARLAVMQQQRAETARHEQAQSNTSKQNSMVKTEVPSQVDSGHCHKCKRALTNEFQCEWCATMVPRA